MVLTRALAAGRKPKQLVKRGGLKPKKPKPKPVQKTQKKKPKSRTTQKPKPGRKSPKTQGRGTGKGKACEYREKKVLGEGVYGRVTKVVDAQNKEWALKALKESKYWRDRYKEGGLLESSVVETSVHGSLKGLPHPNIALASRIDSSCASKGIGAPALVSPLATGGDLDAYIEKNARSTGKDDNLVEKATLAYNIYCGLRYLHRNGWIHHDLKPGNVLVMQDKGGKKKRAQIADLGLADRVEAPIKAEATAGYTAPEAWCDDVWTPASDFWSLGAILTELWFDHELIEGSSRSINDIVTELAPPRAWYKQYPACARKLRTRPREGNFLPPDFLRQVNKYQKRYGIPVTTEMIRIIQTLLSYNQAERLKVDFRPLFKALGVAIPACKEAGDDTIDLSEGATLPGVQPYITKASHVLTKALSRIAGTIWQRLRCTDPKHYKAAKPNAVQNLALISLAGKVLRLDSEKKRSEKFKKEFKQKRSAVIQTEREMSEVLGYNFFGSPNPCDK